MVIEVSFYCVPSEVRMDLSCLEQYCCGVSNLFIPSTKKKKWVSQNTILFWIRSVISHAYWSASDENCRLVGGQHMKSERLLLHCCLWGAAQSSKYWRLVPGCVRAHSQPFTFEMSPTSIWTPSLSSLWWWLKRCNSMVTLFAACDFRSSGPHVQCVIGTLPSLCSSIFRPRELEKPYTRESLVCILSSLLVTVNLLHCMVAVTVSSREDIVAYHSYYQCVIASPSTVQTDSVFLLLGRTRLV